jgi:hypothetical protein
VTRMDGWPKVLRFPGMGRVLFRYSSKYMRRGFDGLLAVAEERTVATASANDEGGIR